jgi:hypothetical protein
MDVTVRADLLALVLEHAYPATHMCATDRAAECCVCEALTHVEEALRPVIPADEMPQPDWWHETDTDEVEFDQAFAEGEPVVVTGREL